MLVRAAAVVVDQAQGADAQDEARDDEEDGHAGASRDEQPDDGHLVPVVGAAGCPVAHLQVCQVPHHTEVVKVDDQGGHAAEAVQVRVLVRPGQLHRRARAEVVDHEQGE